MPPTPPAPAGPPPDGARAPILALRDEVGKVVVGQDGTLSGLVAALLVRGHVLLEGVPGTAKTLLVKAVAAALDLEFKRVQFTPDLMPSDVIGQVIFEPNQGTFRFRQGPVFTNLLLADEINRTPPKTQAALLESMEERQVTIEGQAHVLPDPFIVVATQNPVEYEGTYPLPEAQLDRFLFKLQVGYPSFEQEQEVLARHDRGLDPHDLAAAGIRPVAGAADLARARTQVEALRIEAPVLAYLVALVRATRESPSVTLGVSPRGAPPCCTQPRPGPGWPGATTSPPTRSRPWSSPRCATGCWCAPSSSWRGPPPTGCSTASWRRSRSRAEPSPSPRVPVPIPTRRLAAVVALASIVVLVVDGGIGFLIVNAVLAVVVLVDWATATAPDRIEVARVLPEVVQLGAADRVVWQVTNPTGRRQRIAFADDLAPSLRAGSRRARVRVRRPTAGWTCPPPCARRGAAGSDPGTSPCGSRGGWAWPPARPPAPCPASCASTRRSGPETRPSCGSTRPASSRSASGRPRAWAGAPSSISCATTTSTTSSAASTGRPPPAPARPSCGPTGPSATRR